MKKSARKKKDTFIQKSKEELVEKKVDMIETRKKSILQNRPLVVGVSVILIIIIGAISIYTYTYFQKDATLSSAATDQQVKEILEKIGKLVVLPTGETPTIATVTDIEKLAGQPFFKNAQNGDKVVIIGSTKEAILYRPSINKIITMAPINSSDIGGAPSASNSAQGSNVESSITTTLTPSPGTSSEKIKVAVLNSTKEAGLAKKGAVLLSKEAFEIVATSNAQGEYADSTVSITNKSTSSDTAVKAIVASFKDVKLVTKALPADEATPAGADIVIILGSDFSEA